MEVTYRPMREDDEAAVLELWTTVYAGTDRLQWQREWRSIPQCVDHTSIAVTDDRTVLAAAHYWLRSVRDRDGTPRRVGHVSHVATRPTARRHGHAGMLVRRTIEAMRRDNCAWSVLFTSEEGRALYQRLGWRSYPISYRQGPLAAARRERSPGYIVRRYDPASEPDGWERLAALYHAYNATRPVSLARDHPYWHGFLQLRIAGWLAAGAEILVATPRAEPSDLCGYVLVHVADQGFLLTELAARTGDDAAILALLGAVARQFPSGSSAGGRVHLPQDPVIDAALNEVFAQLEQGYNQEPMARPIAAEVDDGRLAELFAAPGAMFWPMDQI